MRALILVAGACLAAAACTADKGRCLQSHAEHREASMVLIPLVTPNGSGGFTTTMLPQFTPEHDELVCDRWEFPEGKRK